MSTVQFKIRQAELLILTEKLDNQNQSDPSESDRSFPSLLPFFSPKELRYIVHTKDVVVRPLFSSHGRRFPKLLPSWPPLDRYDMHSTTPSIWQLITPRYPELQLYRSLGLV